MLAIKIKSTNRLEGPFEEAGQDEVYQLLSEHPSGLITAGHASCYAVIVKCESSVGLAHVSSGDDDKDNRKFFKQMLRAVASDANRTLKNVTVTLGRSFTGYGKQLEDDKKNDPHYSAQEPDEFFAETDALYQHFFEQQFQITPHFIKMPHEFLLINADGLIDLFEKHQPNDVSFRSYSDADEHSEDEYSEDVEMGSEEESEEEQSPPQEAASSSSSGFFSTPSTSNKRKMPATEKKSDNDASDDERSVKPKH